MTEDLYHNGVKIGESTFSFYLGVKVADTYLPFARKMVDAAVQDKVTLTLASALRTMGEQISLRKQNVKDKSKVNDDHFIMTAPSSNFYPVTGVPGFSNHQSGKAFDFNVTGLPVQYKWLVDNAHKFGFVRTVPSERWHWEYEPTLDQFAVVAKTDLTWDHLV